MALIPRQNLVKASNAMFASAGISALSLIIFLFVNIPVTPSSVISVGILLIMAFFVRGGFKWARYLFVVLLAIGVLVLPFVVAVLVSMPLVLILYTVQIILHIYAAVMMFRQRESEYRS